MRGPELKRWRTKRDLTQTDVAELANAALGRRYSSSSVSAWEKESKPIPAATAAFFEHLISGAEPETFEPPPPGEDRPPLAQPDSVPFAAKGNYARVCEELWGIVGLAFAGIGLALHNPRLVEDGAIIDADKAQLGEVWGRAAEQNETLRKWIGSVSEGGVWLQVAVVTGGTVGRVYRNHSQPPAPPASEDGGVARASETRYAAA